jgi:hypothetical protein
MTQLESLVFWWKNTALATRIVQLPNGTTTRVAQEVVARVYLAFYFTLTGTIQLVPEPVTSNGGILLQSTVSMEELKFTMDKDFRACQNAWSVINNSGVAQQITVMEQIFIGR